MVCRSVYHHLPHENDHFGGIPMYPPLDQAISMCGRRSRGGCHGDAQIVARCVHPGRGHEHSELCDLALKLPTYIPAL